MAQYQMGCMYAPDKSIKKMEALQRNNWWEKANSKGSYIIGWKELNLPKRLKGLGFKNLRYFNEALLAKLAWRMIHERDAKWVQMLQARFCKHGDPLYGEIKRKGTWIWNGIQRGLQWIKRFHVWEVGDTSKINKWQSNWLSEGNAQNF
ncbi:uncharacterized protein LOC113294636 [Papaver somniferum]|uniref:uncharacterized protein LOC113294636 n=1 Tax=Papaver somniferum TaxID=3469 RepID=UPI000E702AC5|nr:uncharacterized protein LOC113294636 [Papaver somniferum]